MDEMPGNLKQVLTKVEGLEVKVKDSIKTLKVLQVELRDTRKQLIKEYVEWLESRSS